MNRYPIHLISDDRRACLVAEGNDHNDEPAYSSNQVAAIIEAKVAAERERCAKLCEERADYYDNGDDDRPGSRRAIACKACASVIRGD